jgi:hypothetical protein
LTAHWWRGWLVPLLLALPLWLVLWWTLDWLPAGWLLPALIIIMGIPNLAIWVASGGTVLAIASWVLPTLIVAAITAMKWNLALHTVLVLLLGLPVISGVFPPIERVLGWYTGRVANAVLPWTLAAADRRAYRSLMEALRPDPTEREAMRQLDDRFRTAAAFRSRSAKVLAVGAPDPAWAKVIRCLAEPGLLYADMLQGLRPIDYDMAAEATKRGNRALLDHLRARSWMYRFLTLRRAWQPADQRSV